MSQAVQPSPMSQAMRACADRTHRWRFVPPVDPGVCVQAPAEL